MNKEVPALSVDQLTVSYEKTPALWDISLQVPQAKLIGILGPNGAGKSTFLKALLGLVKPIAGKIAFFGEPLKVNQKKMAYIPQKEAIDWEFPITVRELVMMGRYGKLGLFKRPRKSDYEALDYYLDLVGLKNIQDRQISQLSGGQQQRTFLARALMQEAEIYFLDEPFAGIDAATETILIKLLKRLVEEGKTVFVVHHDLNKVEKIFDWVILLNLRLIAAGDLNSTFTLYNLKQAYGKNFALLDEATRLAQEKEAGEI